MIHGVISDVAFEPASEKITLYIYAYAVACKNIRSSFRTE